MAKILVIDDDEQVRGLMQQVLVRAGHDVTTAGGGQRGMELFRQERADLIIADILMPGMDGIETILELRRCSPDVKIIAISGGGRLGPDVYLDLAKRCGVSCALSKPIGPRELTGRVAELLASSS